MRALEAGFAAHLASGATTLTTCWRIVRRDGLVLGFTDHDEPLSFGGDTYTPAHGLDGSEAPSKLGAQVDTSEVVGLIHSDAIDESDIVLGRYDGARVETWRVNWRNPDERMLVRTSTVGEIVREDGAFRAELRSGQAALNQAQGRLYQRLCDAELGDARCGVDLGSAAFRADGQRDRGAGQVSHCGRWDRGLCGGLVRAGARSLGERPAGWPARPGAER